MEPKDKTDLPESPKFALYYRSENTGNWYEEGCFSDKWDAKERMLDHVRVHSDMDCVIVKLEIVSEYKGWK